MTCLAASSVSALPDVAPGAPTGSCCRVDGVEGHSRWIIHDDGTGNWSCAGDGSLVKGDSSKWSARKKGDPTVDNEGRPILIAAAAPKLSEAQPRLHEGSITSLGGKTIGVAAKSPADDPTRFALDDRTRFTLNGVEVKRDALKVGDAATVTF